MDHLSMIAVALGLSMDSFASSIACGAREGKHWLRTGSRVVLSFSIVQVLLFLMGFLLGTTLSGVISRFDHWVAFILLTVVAARMVHESLEARKHGTECRPLTNRTILTMALATSIDAFIVGTGFAFLDTGPVYPSLYILIMTALLSFTGLSLGRGSSARFGFVSEIIGALIIFAIGLRILIDGLF